MPEENNPTLTMDQLTENESFPDVQPHAVDAIREEKAVEKIENGFNPEIHAILADGSPKKNKDGSFALKRGRKNGTKNASVLNVPQNNQNPINMESLYAAQTVSGLLEQLQIKLISDEFLYDPLEREANVKAWRETFDHYGGVKLTPPQALALNHAGIIIARSQQEKTRNKLHLFGAYIKDKISSFKFKRKKDAYSDSGPDVERKDDIRGQESDSVKKERNKNNRS